MFTKVEEILYQINRDDDTKNIGKKYVYSDNLSLLDIVNMVQTSEYNINYIDVSVDDDYTYGAGRHSIETFFQMYDSLYSLDSVSFDIEKLNSRILVVPDNNELFLIFRHVKETPETEIEDIIGEKKMKM